jgi:hypothetical protein
MHDFNLFKSCIKKFDLTTKFIADLGYIGINNYFPLSIIPYKSSKNIDLTTQEKESNKKISSRRAKIEHVFCFFKRFNILSTTFRENWLKFNQIFMAIASCYFSPKLIQY